MTTKIFDRTFYNDNNFRIIEEQHQVCNKCGDIKIYHPINLCYNYEPKFNQIKKEIVKPNSWSNYFKSYFVEIKPTVEITYEPVYSENCNPEPSDSGKAYCSSDFISNVGGISPNFPFINKYNLPETGCCNTQLPTVNWLNFSLSLDKLEYIMNGMWVDMTNYIMFNVYKFLTPVKYITENEMKIQNYQVNIQLKNQTYEIEEMKNEMKNMKSQMLYDLTHSIKNEFVKLNKSDNNYKFLIDNSILDIKERMDISEINLDEINLINHKQKTKQLMDDINKFDKEKLNKDKDMLDDVFLQSISNINKLKDQSIDNYEDYEKIEA